WRTQRRNDSLVQPIFSTIETIAALRAVQTCHLRIACPPPVRLLDGRRHRTAPIIDAAQRPTNTAFCRSLSYYIFGISTTLLCGRVGQDFPDVHRVSHGELPWPRSS